MKSKILILLYVLTLSVFIISLVGADSNLGTFKQNECISLYQQCDTCSYVNITSITYPNSTILNINEAMSKNSVDYNYTWCETVSVGDYLYSVCGDKDGIFKCENMQFKITSTGTEMTTGGSIIYFVFFAILIFFFILIIFGISKLPGSNTRDEEGQLISVSWLKYLRSVLLFVDWIILIAIFYIASNLAFAYLGESLFAQTLFMFYRICFVLTLPIVVIWFIWIFVSIFKDKKLKRMISKGIYPSGNL